MSRWGVGKYGGEWSDLICTMHKSDSLPAPSLIFYIFVAVLTLREESERDGREERESSIVT